MWSTTRCLLAISHPLLPAPTSDTTRNRVGFTKWPGSQVLFQQDLSIVRRNQLHRSDFVLLHRSGGTRQRSGTGQAEPRGYLGVAAIAAHHDHAQVLRRDGAGLAPVAV